MKQHYAFGYGSVTVIEDANKHVTTYDSLVNCAKEMVHANMFPGVLMDVVIERVDHFSDADLMRLKTALEGRVARTVAATLEHGSQTTGQGDAAAATVMIKTTSWSTNP